MKDKYVLGVLAIIAIIGISFGFYMTGFNIGEEEGWNAGQETGYTKGNATGYAQGYTWGYDRGNEAGYQIGKDDGLSEGYTQGHQVGKAAGLQEGYANGMRDGEEIGYQSGYVRGREYGEEVGYELGYESGWTDAIEAEGWTLVEPTYTQMMAFIASDRTDRKKYDEDTYNCENFAADVKWNAMRKGYHSFFISVNFPEGAHAILSFNTTDRGMIYIEPQGDEIVRPVVGKVFYDRKKYYAPNFDDYIVRILLIP